MATFALDLLSGKVFLFVPDFGTGGTSGGTFNGYPEVNTYADLPAAGAYNGKTYLVRTATGAYILDRNESGLYYSNGVTWYRLGDIPSFFSSNNFQIYDGTDNTKGFDFITSGITTGVFRELKIQDKNGTIALLSDLNTKVDLSVFQYFTGTTVPATYLNISNFNTYSGTTVPATYLSISNFSIYSGTTVPATYLNISNFSIYSGITSNNINYISGQTRIFSRKIITGSSYSIQSTDSLLGIKGTSGGTVTLTLPLANSVVSGKYFQIKDEASSASIGNIIVNVSGSDKIENTQTQIIMSINGIELTFYSNGNNKWYII